MDSFDPPLPVSADRRPDTLAWQPADSGLGNLLRDVGGKGVGLVFASRLANTPYAFEGCWREALKQAKLRDFRFRDLRHTCASMLAQNGATLLEIGDVLVHRQLQMTKRYSHLDGPQGSAGQSCLGREQMKVPDIG